MKQPPMCKNCLRDESQHVPGWYCQKFVPRKGRGRVLRSVATMDDIRALVAFGFRQAADFIERGGDPKSAASGIVGMTSHALSTLDVPRPREEKPHREEKPGQEGLSRGEEKVLMAILQAGPDGASRAFIQQLTGLSARTISNYTTELRGRGLLEGAPAVATKEGEAVAKRAGYKELPTGDKLYHHWLAKLSKGEAELLATFHAAYPEALSRAQIQGAVHYSERTISNYTTQLIGKRLIVKDGVKRRASADLFDPPQRRSA